MKCQKVEAEDIGKMLQLMGKDNKHENEVINYLSQKYKDDLPQLLSLAYKASKIKENRSYILSFASLFSRTSKCAIELGISALFDRSKSVRYDACALLAWSQDCSLIDRLIEIRNRVHKTTIDDLDAVIDSLRHRNANYFVDRNHTGQISWGFYDSIDVGINRIFGGIRSS